MSTIKIPIGRFFFGNEHWRSNRAVEEIRIYCDLLDILDDRIDKLADRGREEESMLVNVQAVISSYAIEIGLKSLWALDHPGEKVPFKHNLVWFFDGLGTGTVQSLDKLGLKRKSLESSPVPFIANRYSMENANRDITVFDTGFLRQLAEYIDNKVEETRQDLLGRPQAPGT